jgi:peptidoglycan L-alanyl-D-glutamate endopeptidase CwlK
MDRTSEQRLGQVHPVLAAKIRQLANSLSAEGIEIRVVQGLRTYQEQAALYAKGRTAPGPKVTNAPAGSSYHNYGMAVDVCPGIPGVSPWQPDWKATDAKGPRPTWARMITLAKKLGLTSGADFQSLKDFPHLQLTGNMPIGAPTPKARQMLASGSDLPTLWALAGLPVTQSAGATA